MPRPARCPHEAPLRTASLPWGLQTTWPRTMPNGPGKAPVRADKLGKRLAQLKLLSALSPLWRPRSPLSRRLGRVPLASSSCTFPMTSQPSPAASSHIPTFQRFLRKKHIKPTLRQIFDIYLKAEIGGKSAVILGHANHSRNVIISIHIEQVLYDEPLKSYFPKISRKFKQQDLIELLTRRLSCEPSAFASFCSPSSASPPRLGWRPVSPCPPAAPAATSLLCQEAAQSPEPAPSWRPGSQLLSSQLPPPRLLLLHLHHLAAAHSSPPPVPPPSVPCRLWLEGEEFKEEAREGRPWVGP